MSLQEALETLSLLPDWEQRYTYLIELVKVLPPMPEAEKIPTNMVKGCISQVWLTHTWKDGKLSLQLDSDAVIVKGLLALVFLAFNGQAKTQIAHINLPELLAPTQLLNHLSPNRRSGFAAVTARIAQL